MLSAIFRKTETKKYVIASPIQGVLLREGIPVKNEVITRVLKWNARESELVEHFKTDQDGYFSMPLYEDTLKMSNLNQFVANQTLLLNFEKDTEEPIWISGQLSGKIYGETGGQKIEQLTCDITDELLPVYGDGVTLLSTKCRWKDIVLEE